MKLTFTVTFDVPGDMPIWKAADLRSALLAKLEGRVHRLADEQSKYFECKITGRAESSLERMEREREHSAMEGTDCQCPKCTEVPE